VAQLSIPYAADTSTWQDWQLEYRWGAFYVFPPAGIIEYVDELRAFYDPASHHICQAHVSLSEPLPRALASEDLRVIERTLAGFKPFSIRYRNVHATPPYPGVVYDIEPQDTILDLRSLLHSVTLFEDSQLSRRNIPAHMTIAEFVSLDESHSLAAQLRGAVREGEWLCDQIEYAVPNEGMVFQRILSIHLGASV
jgi:hypothetical protein